MRNVMCLCNSGLTLYTRVWRGCGFSFQADIPAADFSHYSSSSAAQGANQWETCLLLQRLVPNENLQTAQAAVAHQEANVSTKEGFHVFRLFYALN